MVCGFWGWEMKFNTGARGGSTISKVYDMDGCVLVETFVEQFEAVGTQTHTNSGAGQGQFFALFTAGFAPNAVVFDGEDDFAVGVHVYRNN